MRGKYLILAIPCIAVALVAMLWWGSRARPDSARPSGSVVVLPSSVPVTPTPNPTLPASVEVAADTAAIAPYRAEVRQALELGPAAMFRSVTVANARQRVVCGEVSKSGGSDYHPFVYVGFAALAAIDDGSPDFREMQKGACGNATR